MNVYLLMGEEVDYYTTEKLEAVYGTMGAAKRHKWNHYEGYYAYHYRIDGKGVGILAAVYKIKGKRDSKNPYKAAPMNNWKKIAPK